MTWKTPAGTLYDFYADLLQQKHLLIAGATGSGKSVIVNGLIYTALFKAPGNGENAVQLILIDQKGSELIDYRRLPHTLRYAQEPTETVDALQYAVSIIEQRNKENGKRHVKMFPGSDIYIVIDEFADLITTNKKAVVPLIQRIAQIGRSARVHIILCTQCPLAQIIPTTIKCNFDSVLGLHTARAQDSRNIIGVTGCEKLPQYGECYYQKPGAALTRYINIPMIPDCEITIRIRWWEKQNKGLRRLFLAV